MVAYYAATRLFLDSQNPYDWNALRRIRDETGRDEGDKLVKWLYPPWVLPAFSPFFVPMALLPFLGAVLFWGILNLLFLIGTGLMIWNVTAGKLKKNSLIPCILASLLFIPAYDALQHGQITLLVAFGISAFLYFSQRKKDWLAALCLLFPASKATVWYLLVPLLAWWVIKYRRWKILIGFAAFVGISFLIAELQVPSITTYWLEALPQVKSHSIQFRNPTLVDVLNNGIFNITGQVPVWPQIAIPSVCALAFLLWLIIRPPRPELSATLCPVLMLSVATAPYCWFFDQAVLVIVQVTLVAQACKEHIPVQLKRHLFVSLIALQLVTLCATFAFEEQFHFWWFPLALMALWFYFYPQIKVEQTGQET